VPKLRNDATLQIQVKFLPARDGSPLGFLRVIMPDERVIQISAGNRNE